MIGSEWLGCDYGVLILTESNGWGYVKDESMIKE